MKAVPSEDNPDCPECGHSKTRIRTQIVKTFSYECPNCDTVFKSGE